MRITGANVVDEPVAAVWVALLDPRVLVATIPGCERLEATGEHAYAMTVTAGVAAIKGTYTGSCELSALDPHRGLTMHLSGSGAPGTVDATVQVSFSEPEPGRTEIAYEAEAVVGGMVGGVGQRMLASVSKRMAGEFFANVAAAIAAPPAAVTVETSDAGAPTAYTAPAKTGRIGSQDDFVKGIAVGAGLVLVGVLAGALLGRRR